MKLDLRQYTYEHGEGVTRRLTRSTVLGIIAFILLALVVASVGARQWYVANLSPLDVESTELIQVNIEEGSGGAVIARQLEDEGVIRNANAFRIHGYLSGSLEDMKAGLYEFSPRMSVEKVMELIVEGKVATRNITILSGLRLEQIRSVMIDNGFLPDEIDAAFGNKYQSVVFQQKPADKPIEGFIYPDTYEITNETTPRQLVQQTLHNFDQRITNELIQSIEAQDLTFYEGLTLASIVQQEVTGYEDKRKVTQVFLTRLNRGMPLGADPTFKYAAAQQGVEPSTDIESPYNTRIHAGLPPTPIGNVTLDTLQAVANPANTDFLYFVSGDDGTNHFSKNLAEHQRNIDRYCTELCQ